MRYLRPYLLSQRGLGTPSRRFLDNKKAAIAARGDNAVPSAHPKKLQAQVSRPQKRPQAAFSLFAKTMLKH